MFVVMSDSHYDRDVVQSIKSKYLNEATAIFHAEILNFLVLMKFGKE